MQLKKPSHEHQQHTSSPHFASSTSPARIWARKIPRCHGRSVAVPCRCRCVRGDVRTMCSGMQSGQESGARVWAMAGAFASMGGFVASEPAFASLPAWALSNWPGRPGPPAQSRGGHTPPPPTPFSNTLSYVGFCRFATFGHSRNIGSWTPLHWLGGTASRFPTTLVSYNSISVYL